MIFLFNALSSLLCSARCGQYDVCSTATVVWNGFCVSHCQSDCYNVSSLKGTSFYTINEKSFMKEWLSLYSRAEYNVTTFGIEQGSFCSFWKTHIYLCLFGRNVLTCFDHYLGASSAWSGVWGVQPALHKFDMILSSRIESIKMNILPRLLYLFQTLLIKIEQKQFNKWKKILARCM